MKFFNCEDCSHKKNLILHNYHCPFYKEMPDNDFCPMYDKEQVLPFHNYKDLIKKKAIDLYNRYSDATEYDIMDWDGMIKSHLSNSIIEDDFNKITSFIKRFGDSGLFFTCNKCNYIIELDDDREAKCSNCGFKEFSFHSI